MLAFLGLVGRVVCCTLGILICRCWRGSRNSFIRDWCCASLSVLCLVLLPDDQESISPIPCSYSFYAILHTIFISTTSIASF